MSALSLVLIVCHVVLGLSFVVQTAVQGLGFQQGRQLRYFAVMCKDDVEAEDPKMICCG